MRGGEGSEQTGHVAQGGTLNDRLVSGVSNRETVSLDERARAELPTVADDSLPQAPFCIEWGPLADRLADPLARLLSGGQIADAFELDRRLRMARSAMQRVDFQLGRLLRMLAARRGYRHLGFRTFDAYVTERLGFSRRKASLLVAIERKSWRSSTTLTEALRSGAITTLKAAALLPIIEERTAAAWIERAGTVTLRRLRDEVQWALDKKDLEGRAAVVFPPPPTATRADLEEGVRAAIEAFRRGIAAKHDALSDGADGCDGSDGCNGCDGGYVEHEGECERYAAQCRRRISGCCGCSETRDEDSTDSNKCEACGRNHGTEALRQMCATVGGGVRDAFDEQQVANADGAASVRQMCATVDGGVGDTFDEQQAANADGAASVRQMCATVDGGVGDTFDERQAANADGAASVRQMCATSGEAGTTPDGIIDAPLTANISFTGPRSVVLLLADAMNAWSKPEEAPWKSLWRLLVHVIGTWIEQPRHRDPVFERDGWRCMVPGCSSRRNLQDHHVVMRSRGGDNSRGNRVALCVWHHLRGIHGDRVRVSGEAPGNLHWEIGVRRDGDPLLVLDGERYVGSGVLDNLETSRVSTIPSWLTQEDPSREGRMRAVSC